jgi:hypothetical protein
MKEPLVYRRRRAVAAGNPPNRRYLIIGKRTRFPGKQSLCREPSEAPGLKRRATAEDGQPSNDPPKTTADWFD